MGIGGLDPSYNYMIGAGEDVGIYHIPNQVIIRGVLYAVIFSMRE